MTTDIDINTLFNFLPTGQLKTILSNLKGEEGGYFEDLLTKLSSIVKSAPTLYETDGQGEDTKAILHYFFGNIDVYIVEIDKDTHECFGYTSLGLGCFEAGYLYLKDLFKQVPMLNYDFDFTSMNITDLKKIYAE